MSDQTEIAALGEALSRIVGEDRVAGDAAARDLFSQDIWSKAPSMARWVVSPSSVGELSEIAALATSRGWALAVRGGGMSYTGGFAPQSERTLILDLTRMNRVLAVDADSMTVSVEAGCSWKALREALAPVGLRTPFWGPMSGFSSTIGGGLSHHNAIFGSGHHGTTCESVVGLSLVLPDGTLLRTGAGTERPFYRFYGPDLTGLFAGDNGVFGIKAEITLRLMRAPAAEDYASFIFKDRETCFVALTEIVRSGVACETFGFDPNLAKARLRRASLIADVKTLGRVVSHQNSLFQGLVEAAKVTLAGRGLVGEEDYSIHLVCEGRCAAAVEHDMATARKIARAANGTEIENTIPKVVRSQPFTPLNNVVGASGERWVPVHGIVPLGRAAAVYAEIEDYFASRADDFERKGVETAFMFTGLSTNGFLIEPVFTWPEARNALHEATIEPAVLAKMKGFAPNPSATALVAEARQGVIDIFARHGAAHFQIGRTYPYRQSRDPASIALLDAIKTTLDPRNTLNPGALGFPR